MLSTVQSFFDPKSHTYSYVVADFVARTALIIDPVLDYDPISTQTSTGLADALIDYINAHELTLDWILETHVHADHLSAATYIKQQVGGKIGISARVAEVQALFRQRFNIAPDFFCASDLFDALFADGDQFGTGPLSFRVLCTPGHTPACLTYVFEGYAFVGDTVFMPDYGTARADFPGGSARTLYHSIRKILALPRTTRLYLCHDYGTAARTEFKNITTVAEQCQHNPLVNTAISEDEFVADRERRDLALKAPALLNPAVPFNMCGGLFPLKSDDKRLLGKA